MKEGNRIILIGPKALLKPAARGPSAPQPLTATQWKITSKQIEQASLLGGGGGGGSAIFPEPELGCTL